MAIRLTTTSECCKFTKTLVYGPSGIGKTVLGSTAPDPLIISAESGLLSIKDKNLPVIMIDNHLDLREAYNFVTRSAKARRFQTVVLDSITDIGEVVLAYFRENPEDNNTHPQAAYGAMATAMTPLIKDFRDIDNKHVYMIARAKLNKDDYTGITSYVPSMPGQVLLQALPYEFDFLMPMRIGLNDDNEEYRYLQTKSDFQWLAKDRSHKLDEQEEPNLTAIFEKAMGK